MMPFHQLAMRGFAYLFAGNNPPLNAQDIARRAGFQQFQSYPANTVQGAGTLVGTPGSAGNYWRVTKPQVAYQTLTPILSDLTGGGVPAGGLLMMPLTDTTQSQG